MNLRRKDTTKGPPLRILSLDGGGVRGYSMLIILQELMYRAYVEAEGKPPKREEIPKPCEYFDLIAGTGTGGLIALMLGRLRLDLETCMDVYVRMTKKVFETDKTIAGIPYKTTLFKASKLEEAIKGCVREHTIFEDEGNDGTATGGKEFQDITSPMTPTSGAARRSMSVRSASTVGVNSPASNRNSMATMPTLGPGFARWGNENASLYDGRENRTKTAVTAVYKGTNPKTGSAIFLRSYDSRKEPPPEFNCTIWQAGRATSATGLAFKPIKIGQSVFIDEGAGKYNPSPQVLEEAATNEWPGREVGMFVSVGTGKRPAGTNQQQHEWWEGFVGGSVGNFAEARRRLISKIEGCEDTHVQMINTELPRRGVPVENYVRLNVEVGVGEFGMNEWDRLSEMTIGTRRYLKKHETQALLENAASKMAKIELVRRRMERHQRAPSHNSVGAEQPLGSPSVAPVPPGAVELPASTGDLQPPYSTHRPGSAPYSADSHSIASSQDKFMVVPEEMNSPRRSHELPYRASSEKFSYTSPTGAPPRHSSNDYAYPPTEPPPRPPKTPINEGGPPPSYHQAMPARPNGNVRLPYPDTDGPPPIVNKLRKPEYRPA